MLRYVLPFLLVAAAGCTNTVEPAPGAELTEETDAPDAVATPDADELVDEEEALELPEGVED